VDSYVAALLAPKLPKVSDHVVGPAFIVVMFFVGVVVAEALRP
jgi:hypothetical protein